MLTFHVSFCLKFLHYLLRKEYFGSFIYYDSFWNPFCRQLMTSFVALPLNIKLSRTRYFLSIQIKSGITWHFVSTWRTQNEAVFLMQKWYHCSHRKRLCINYSLNVFLNLLQSRRNAMHLKRYHRCDFKCLLRKNKWLRLYFWQSFWKGEKNVWCFFLFSFVIPAEKSLYIWFNFRFFISL